MHISADMLLSLDVEWFALDELGHLACLATGARAEFPKRAGFSLEELGAVRTRLECDLAPFTTALPSARLIESRSKAVDSFSREEYEETLRSLATRGVYCYDVNYGDSQFPAGYVLLMSPQLPLERAQLPSTVAEVVSRAVLRGVRFGEDHILTSDAIAEGQSAYCKDDSDGQDDWQRSSQVRETVAPGIPPASPARRNSTRVPTIVMGVLVIAAATYLAIDELRLRRTIAATAGWPTTTGTLLRADEVTGHRIHGVDFKVFDVKYVYVVNGTEYVGDRFSLGPVENETRERYVEALARRSPVQVCYDPRDPASAFLERADLPGTTDLTIWTVGLALVGVGIIMSAVVPSRAICWPRARR